MNYNFSFKFSKFSPQFQLLERIEESQGIFQRHPAEENHAAGGYIGEHQAPRQSP